MTKKLKEGIIAMLYLLKIHFLMFRISMKHFSFWRLKFLHYIF